MPERPVAVTHCRCEWPDVGPGIYPRCLRCDGRIGPSPPPAVTPPPPQDGQPSFAPAPARRLDPEVERKVEAYDAARATVKIEGNSRAYYVLRAEAAEAEVASLRDALEVARDLLAADGYDRDPDYTQEWATIEAALVSGTPPPDAQEREAP